MATVTEIDQNTNLTPSPTRPDGASWPFALLVGDDTVYADTRTELVAHVIPGYVDFAGDDAGDVLAFLARVDSAAGIVSEVQAVVLASATEDGDFVAEDESEIILTALLTPRGTGLIDGVEFGGVWTHEVPLLLLTTDYAPFTDNVPITGNVEYFDPSDETTYLEGLQSFGFVELFVNAAL